MKSGIYSILNIVNNKVYIGSAVNLKKRINSHRYSLYRNRHRNSHLQFDWNKYKENSFKFDILEKVKNKNLLVKEQYWMDHYRCYISKFGYNICLVAGNTLGIKHSEETKKKMKGKIFSNEHKRRMSESRKGYRHTDEVKRKISEANKGNKNFLNHKHTDETKRRLSEANKKHKHTDETKRKISEANKGRPSWNKGVSQTVEARKKMSNSRLGMKMKLNFKKIMSKATKGENNGMYGRKHTEKTKIIIREKLQQRGGYKGHKNPHFGKKHSRRTKIIIADKLKLRGGHLGQNNPNNKIKEREFEDIINLRNIKKCRIVEIASKYNVCGNTIYNILNKVKNYAKAN